MARRSALKIGTVVVAVVVAAGSLGWATPKTARPPAGLLHVDGRWLKDARGRVVILHGVNAVWKIDQASPPAHYYPPDAPNGFVKADASMIRGLGFNVVRLGWIWKGLERTRGNISGTYLDQIARVADLLGRQNVFVLVDSHQDMLNEKYSGEGAPDWATVDDGVPNLKDAGVDLGFPGNYLTPATSRAFDNLYSTFRADYARAWSAVANRFAGMPYILGYDVLNEPWPGTQYPTCAQPVGCPVADRTVLQPFEDAAAAAIRAEDARHIVFYSPYVLFNFGVESWLQAPPAAVGKQVGFGFHDYCLAGDIGAITGQQQLGAATTSSCPAFDDLVFRNAASASSAMGAAPLETEFGAGDDLAELERYIELADSNMTGWIYWQYKNWSDPTGAAGSEGLFTNDGDLKTLKQAKADVLSRVYPMEVAGVPIRYSFDPATHVFAMDYTADPSVKAPTVIFVPGRHFPHGYRVIVTGAKQTSAPGAAYLTLKNSGAGTVHVEVIPKS